MLIQASANRPLDQLIEAFCLELGLSAEQRSRAASAYQSVGDWLTDGASNLTAFKPRVFAQGSIPLGTAVRPRQTGEFDADGVCLLQEHAARIDPQTAYSLVLGRIREHGTYRDKVAEEERCIRVEYEGQLHLDIIPAIPDPMGGTRILIPSRDRARWQTTNPEGFQAWFASRKQHRPVTFGEKRADAEPMPKPEAPGQLAALQRVVQLMKRRRDVYFEGSSDKPKSILLTTLAAHHYGYESVACNGLSNTLQVIRTTFPPSAPPRVPNPVEANENLARHWVEDPASYRAFRNFVEDFSTRLASLIAARGTSQLADALRDLFDPQDTGMAKRAVVTFTEQFAREREGGHIKAAVGAAASRVAIPRNSFYGR